MKPGERYLWKWKSRGGLTYSDLIMEVVNSQEIKIVQILSSNDQDDEIGGICDLSWVKDKGEWIYLKGQDKPLS